MRLNYRLPWFFKYISIFRLSLGPDILRRGRCIWLTDQPSMLHEYRHALIYVYHEFINEYQYMYIVMVIVAIDIMLHV